MRSYRKYLILAMALLMLFTISGACANDLDNATLNGGNSSAILSDAVDEAIGESFAEITVNDWDDLQYYCSQSDKNYVLKLKENTNYYPTNLEDESYQIQVNNNVTILGSSGAYFGDSSPNARNIQYIAINVPENSGYGITLKNITFKWISIEFQPNAIFLQMAGNANNVIENCQFNNCTLTGGHSSLVYLLRGDVTLTNCSFTNITSDYGCLSLYDPMDNPMEECTHACGEVDNCYFEGNYARSEPGCINNCGVLVVRNSTFYKNTAFWWAGAIHTHGGANTTIYDSNFTDNLAGWNGGALYTYSYLQIYNTIFKGNNCTTNNGGGAIGASKYLHCPYIHIEDSLFEDNENLCWGLSELSTTGTGRGGAISLMDEGALTVLNTTFIKNSASIGTAICAIAQGTYGSPNVTIIGNRFINHTRIGDVLVIKLNYDSNCEIAGNYYLANSIEFSKLKLIADERVGDEVTIHVDAALKNPGFYDSDILDKSLYDVYMDGQYLKTVNSTDFVLNLKNIEKAQVYVVPSISVSKSSEVSVGMPVEYVHVSQKSGSDNNNGSKDAPVKTIAKAIELASATGNIIIMDGTFAETNINIDYDLTMVGESDVVISSKGNVFTIGNDAEVAFKNLTFKNCKQASSTSERIIRQTGGSLTIDNCTFESNSYIALIQSEAPLEANNLKFSKNTGILIQSDNYIITSAVFEENTATTKTKASTLIKSDAGEKGVISNAIFLNNDVIDGCIYFYGKNLQNKLSVSDSTFTGNSANDGSSGILMPYSGLLDVKSSLFINNTDSGKNGALILTSTEVHVSDSIFSGNVISNSNNALINAKSATNLKKIYCDGNWFGNTYDNYNAVPPISSSSNCNYWLFLNATANDTSLFQQESALVLLDLNNVYNINGNISYWDSSNLPTVKLAISAIGGKTNENEVTLVYGFANVIFTLNDVEGTLTASYNDINATVKFTESKTDPNMNVTFIGNISVGDSEDIEVFLPDDATGTLTLSLNNLTLAKDVMNSKTIFNIVDMSAGENNGVITYSGDAYYSSVNKNIVINVNKFNSTTKLSVGDINVGQDVVLTVRVYPNVDGNVTLIINSEEKTLELNNSKATYTINAISRGDYDIKAIYNGNHNYSVSQDSIRFDVAKINTTMDVGVNDITYGEVESIEITLNDTATGNVTVIVDGNDYTSSVINGKSMVNISGLTAGSKVAEVIYGGSNIFYPNKDTVSFTVSKAATPLTVSVKDIMIGDSENIEVTVSYNVDGNITVTCANQMVTKSIPRTGKISWTLSNLPLGTYEVTAVLNSNNYMTVSNNTEFTVSDYEAPQWPNEGYDVQNAGTSPYSTDSNGAILWSYNAAGEVIGNLAIDSNGNICFITTTGIYSIDNNGNQLWVYGSAGEGNYSGLAISRDIVIAPESGNTIHFINQNSGDRFGNSNIYQGSSLFAPIVDADANVYIASEYQHASEDYKLVIIPYNIWQKGGNPYSISLGKSSPSSAPVVVNDNIVVVGCENDIKIIDIRNKAVLSSIKGNTNGIRPVVDSGNMIYAVLDGNVVKITPQGNLLWKTKITGGAGKSLVLNEEFGLYSLNSKGNLYKYDSMDGSEALVSNLTFTSDILIGIDGNVYVGLNDMLYAFDSEDDLLWKANIGNDIVGRPVVDDGGIIYLASSDKIYALHYAKSIPMNFTAKTNDITFGETAEITVNLPYDAMGYIRASVGDDSYNAGVIDGVVHIEIPYLSGGKHIVNVTYSGDNRYESVSISLEINVFPIMTKIDVINKDIYYSNDFIAVLSDLNNRTIAGETLFVNINGENHTFVSDNTGRIYLNLKLNEGIYTAIVYFKGYSSYCASNVTSQINVMSTIQANDMKRGYNSGVDFNATFFNRQGDLLSDAKVTFIINGIEYNATTDNKGVTVLNAKLSVGTYEISIINPSTGENITRESIIVKRITNNNDLTMDYLDGSYFKVRIIGDDGGYVGAGEIVAFKIGSRSATARTNANGYASVKITDVPKKYTVKTTYKGYTVSNKLVVKQVLKAKNVSKKKAKSYKFSATLKTSKGKAISGKKITFKIKGKKYTAKTNKKGVATITIKLKLKVGKYTITSTYSKTSIKNKLTIKK